MSHINNETNKKNMKSRHFSYNKMISTLQLILKVGFLDILMIEATLVGLEATVFNHYS